MDKKKRLKTSHHAFVEVKCSPKSEYLIESSTIGDFESRNRTENNYFSKLPNEVVLHIYRYLSPLDMLSLAHLNKRFNELIPCVREANFSSNHRANPEQIRSYFSRLRVQYIQELNFNYNIYTKPCVLGQLICRCKNLIELSVIECGITNNLIVKIFQSCTKLENFSWSIACASELLMDVCCPNMKSVHLFYFSKEVSSVYLDYFISKFPNIEFVLVNLTPAFPFHDFWLKSFNRNVSYEKFVVLTNSFLPLMNSLPLDRFPPFFCFNQEDFLRRLMHPSQNRVCDYPPYLQIRSIAEDALLLSSSDRYHVYSSLAILLTCEFVHVSESLVKGIEKVAGDKLKHLSIQCEADSVFEGDIKVDALCELTKTIYCISLCCQNITVLNIPTIHFVACSPFKAITQLKNLRTLNIPSCAFRKKNCESQECQSCEFHEVVSSCQKVQNFSLIGCLKECSHLLDADLYPLKGWKELKNFTMYHVVFRTFTFLKRVAESCEKLKSLSIISDCDYKTGLFISDVIYVLKFAKNLSFIRINTVDFNPMHERFWDSIKGAVNLEGICIVTHNRAYIDRQIIIKAIKELKYLHLFHFFHKRFPQNLSSDVRHSMKKNGVINIRIEGDSSVPVIPTIDNLEHQQPQNSCSFCHFELLDI